MQCRARQPAAWGVRQNLPSRTYVLAPTRLMTSKYSFAHIFSSFKAFFWHSHAVHWTFLTFCIPTYVQSCSTLCSAVIAICNCGSIKLYTVYTFHNGKQAQTWLNSARVWIFTTWDKKYVSSVSVMSLECLRCISAMSQKCLSCNSAVSQLYLCNVSALSRHCLGTVSALSQHCLSTASALSLVSALSQHSLTYCLSIVTVL